MPNSVLLSALFTPLLLSSGYAQTWSFLLPNGVLVEINHGNGYVTRYAHNKDNLVAVGDEVEKGQTIALMGSTGRATGPNLHFEVLHNGRVVNPLKYIQASK